MRSTRVSIALALSIILAGCGGSIVSPGGGRTPAPSPQASSGAAATTTPTPVMSPDVQGLLEAKRVDWGVPGALVLLERDGERWFAASGSADLAGSPITDQTRFRIASITKPIVAALVVDAAARGELSLDDVVAELLPGVLRADPPVTVRQLLDHSSGIFDEINDADPVADIERLTDPALQAEALATLERYRAGERVIASDRVLVALAETHDRYFEPGTDYHYSNTNYQLAAMVLEAATGMPLGDLLETRIVRPLGLEHTTIAPPDTTSPELRGYMTSVDGSTPVDVTDDLVLFGNGGNGGVMATADDLLTMMQAIVADGLRPGLFEELEPTGGGAGLGFFAYRTPCGIHFGHEGSVNGTGSIALISPRGGGVVIAVNQQSPMPTERPNLRSLADQLLCPG